MVEVLIAMVLVSSTLCVLWAAWRMAFKLGFEAGWKERDELNPPDYYEEYLRLRVRLENLERAAKVARQ